MAPGPTDEFSATPAVVSASCAQGDGAAADQVLETAHTSLLHVLPPVLACSRNGLFAGHGAIILDSWKKVHAQLTQQVTQQLNQQSARPFEEEPRAVVPSVNVYGGYPGLFNEGPGRLEDVTSMQTQSSFGDLLRRYRLAAGLTQEELAERAGVSANGVSSLERGARQRPWPATVDLLAEALNLGPPDRVALSDAAKGLDATGERSPTELPSGGFLGSLPQGALVGRSSEMDRMRSVLASVERKHGHVLMLAGEMGSGKTRLLQELMVEARHRGFLVVTGICDEDAGPMPFSPFLSPLAQLGEAQGAGRGSEDERQAAAVSDLIRRQDLADAATEASISERVTELLLRASATAPLAVLLDDLHWMDPAGLRLLDYLARSTLGSRVLIGASFCDEEIETNRELASLLERLSHDRLLDLVTVPRLSYDETASYISESMQGSVSEEFIGFAHRRTKGNPRLLDGLVRSLGGRLRLEEEIGAGAMGRVFRAHDAVTGRTVAAKLMLARAGIGLDELLRFQQEGAILRSLDHPNIVRIFDSFADEHVACIVMELLEGGSLARELDAGPMDLDRAKSIALQTSEALSYAHAQSIVHRDVKPDNIMILDGDRVKVTDFGVARILSVDTKMGTIATTGMRVGTPLYMAPEQIEGKRVDARSDVYGFGAVLYHTVTGRPPFEGDDALAIAVQQMKAEPAPPSTIRRGLPPEWDALILKALAKDPRRRFQSSKEMKASIERLNTAALAKPRRSVKRRRFIGAAIAAAVVVMAGGLTAMTARSGSASGASLSSYLSGLAAEGNLSGTVLVAKDGKVILDRGYGMANRAASIANEPSTEYGLADATTTSLLTADVLQGTALGYADGGLGSHPLCQKVTVGLVGPTTLLGGACPKQWRRITPAQLVSGTLGLPEYRWGRPGNGIDQTERACWSSPLAPSRPSQR